MKIRIKRKTVYGSLATVCLSIGMFTGVQDEHPWITAGISVLMFGLAGVFLYFGDLSIIQRQKRRSKKHEN